MMQWTLSSICTKIRPVARPARGPRNSRPTPERLELAAAILWFHTHVNDPEPALSRLPDYNSRACLAECFVEAFAIFGADSKWPSKLASFFKIFSSFRIHPPEKRAAQPARTLPGAVAPPSSTPTGGGAAAGQRVDKGVPAGQVDDQDSEIEGGMSAITSLSGDPDFSSMGGALLNLPAPLHLQEAVRRADSGVHRTIRVLGLPLSVHCAVRALPGFQRQRSAPAQRLDRS